MKRKKILLYGCICALWMLWGTGCGQKEIEETKEAVLAEGVTEAGDRASEEEAAAQKDQTGAAGTKEAGDTGSDGVKGKDVAGRSEEIEDGEKTDNKDSNQAESHETGAEGTQGNSSEVKAGGSSESTPSALSVSGTQLVDGSGNPVQLKGISTHGLAWYPEYVNAECFGQLKEEWGANVIRLAMYTAENGGYCTGGNQDDLKALVKQGVSYATDCGLYVIIDWHILSDGNPNTYLEEAKKFFREMAETYGDYDNVLYEICNEPNGGTSWSQIKAYAEQIIPVIREEDRDGIILVGTPNWSQYVDQAAADPITGYDNIMYTLHFYAATHTDSLRDTMVGAIQAGLPLFVSEYGICDASGNGAIDRNQADKWVETMDEYGISYVAWNLSNKSETSAIFKSSCSKISGFGQEDLSDSGQWLVEMLNNNQPQKPAGDGAQTGKEQSNDLENKEIQSSQETPSGNKEAGEAVGSDELSVETKIINTWKQDNENYYQYEVTITNTGDTAKDGWSISLTFEGDITLQDSWNGNYQVQGNTLTISQMDYNGHIEAGSSVGNIGFIVKGSF